MNSWYKEFAKIGDHIIEGEPLDLKLKGNIVIDPKRKPKIILDRNGKIVELYISQSLIKQFYSNFNEILPCPYRIYESELLQNFRRKSTESMNKGRYFETLCIGAGVDGEAIYDLLIEGLPNYEYPVKGGLVSVEVFDSNGELNALLESYTDTDGRFGESFNVPGQVGDRFKVVITILTSNL